MAAEYEFFQFRAPVDPTVPTSERNSSSTARFLKENPANSLPPLTEGMFGYSLTRPVHNQDYYYGIYDTCEKFRCDIEGWHTESGPGVFEAVRLGLYPAQMTLSLYVAGSSIRRNKADGGQGWTIQVWVPEIVKGHLPMLLTFFQIRGEVNG